MINYVIKQIRITQCYMMWQHRDTTLHSEMRLLVFVVQKLFTITSIV